MNVLTLNQKRVTKTTLNQFSMSLKNSLKNANGILNDMNVALPFRTHYVNIATGANGIELLIASILENKNAVNVNGVESTALRNVAIKTSSMFASDIIAAVRKQFGFDRYPDATVFQYLSVNMVRNGTVGKIKLSNVEDKNRSSFKPRVKYYLVKN